MGTLSQATKGRLVACLLHQSHLLLRQPVQLVDELVNLPLGGALGAALGQGGAGR